MLPFKLEILPGEYTESELLKISNISNIKFEERSMSLNVNYTNADAVSMSGKPDRIYFEISDEAYFLDIDGLTI